MGYTMALRDLGCGNSCCFLICWSMELFTLLFYELKMEGKQSWVQSYVQLELTMVYMKWKCVGGNCKNLFPDFPHFILGGGK